MILRAELLDINGDLAIAPGDTVEALVTAIDDDAGLIVLRARPGQGPATPAELATAHAHGFPVEGTVEAAVKGGVEVTVSGVRGFCPVSQLDTRFVEDPAAWVGRRLSFRILRLEEGRGRPNLVLSRRALLEEEAAAQAAETRTTLEVGKVVTGTVTSLATYGAFVDLGGLEGLLHVSELGHGRVEHPSEVLAEGQEVEVQITKIEPPRDGKGHERISLSRRALLQDPWGEVSQRFPAGSRQQGKVVRLADFGAFVELAPGIDGLLHVGQLGGGKQVHHPREAVRVGETLEVTVLAVEPERRRVSLSLEEPEPGAEELAESRSAAEEGGFGSMGDFFARAKKE